MPGKTTDPAAGNSPVAKFALPARRFFPFPLPSALKPSVPSPHRPRPRLFWLGLLLLTTVTAWALKPTDRFRLRDLESDPALTPKQFAGLFEHFAYDYSPLVLPPDEFLRDRSGDCDDYAILADHVLRRKGFKTRLVRVVLVGTNIGHSVCYVTENKAYLDYNNRKYFINLARSGDSLRSIATKVADSLERNWTSATEYTYTYDEGIKHFVTTVVKKDPPDRDADLPRNRPGT